jgi:sugar/nucleoside kinase (ribokinase family)
VLVCVGDLLEEVLVRLDGDPVRGGDRAVRSARIRGGSAANVAAIDAETGGAPHFVGQVGVDDVGDTLAADLERRGVTTHLTREGGTGVVVTMIGAGGPTRLIDRGTATRLRFVDPAVLDGAEQLYLPAVVFTEDPLADAVDRLLGEVGNRRVAVTIGGPSRAELSSLGAEAFVELCRTVRPAHVVLGVDEHAGIGLQPREPVPGAEVTVVTNGRRPTLVIGHRGETSAVEVPPVERVLDRTGARDGFIAGFLSSRRRRADPVAATHAAHRVAAKVLAQLGPTTGATT